MLGRALVAAIAVIFGLAPLAGCGGADGDTGDTPSSNTEAKAANTNTKSTTEEVEKEEFIAQGNAICAKRTASIAVKGQKVFKENYSKPSEVGAKAIANEVIIPNFEQEIRELNALSPPPGDSDQIYAIYDAIEEVIDGLKANPEGQNFYPYKKAESLAAAYGLTACGHP